VTSIPPGWYPDQHGTTRWWDGAQWTAATQPAQPAAAQPVQPTGPTQQQAEPAQPTEQQPVQSMPPAQPAQPVQPVQPAAASAAPTDPQAGAQDAGQYAAYPQAAYPQASEYPRVTPGTTGLTIWAWLVAFVPLVSTLAGAGYLSSLTGALASVDMSGLATGSPDEAVQALNGVFLNGSYWLVVLLGWLVYAAIVVFAFLDYRALARLGYVKPFHWAWAFIPGVGNIVYIIGRTVVVHRRGGKALGPLWAMIGVWAASFVVSSIAGAVLSAQLVQIFGNIGPQVGGY